MTWPHKVVYDMGRLLFVMIVMRLFMQGYLIIMAEEKEAVRTLMSAHLSEGPHCRLTTVWMGESMGFSCGVAKPT